MRGADPRYDYEYGNNVAAYQGTARPWYSFVFAPQMPTPGAMAYALESQWLAWRPLIGPAIGQAQQFRTFGGQQSMQQAALAAVTGLGGLNHGQVVLQPLVDPYGGS